MFIKYINKIYYLYQIKNKKNKIKFMDKYLITSKIFHSSHLYDVHSALSTSVYIG